MGNPRQKWTQEEEDALRAGVAKHGTGKWINIQQDPEFRPHLYSRSNIDLKDKWRNMSVGANGQGPREKARTPKPKGADSPATPMPISQVPGSSSVAIVPADPVPTDVIMEDSSKCLLDGKTASKYNAMIYEALSTMKDPNGSDTSATDSFIEAKQKWTQEEEDALRAGVAKHGTGKRKNIQKDPEFNRHLYSRSNIDLMDKWRNMSVGANGQGPREKARTPKPKGADSPATPMPISQVPGSSSVAIVPADPVPTDVIMEDSSKCLLDGKTASKYNAMINEALSTLKDPNGSDTSATVSFIEAKQKWTQEEEDALRAGVAKHGTGKWKIIQKDPEFNPHLYSRSNIDLKDKWRNMSVGANGQGPREKARTPKPKGADSPATPMPISQFPGSSSVAIVPADPVPTDVIMEDSSKCLVDGKTASKQSDTAAVNSDCSPDYVPTRSSKWKKAKSGRKRARRGRPTKADSSDQEIVELVGPSAFVIIDDDASVETVVSVWKSAISGVGQEFSDVYEFREALQRYAMANGFEYELKKDYTSRAYGVCTGKGCSWKFNAVWDPTTESFKIKMMNNVHTCDLESRVNSLVITLNEKLQESPHLKPKEIANQLLKDPGAKSGRKRARRGRPTKADSSDQEIVELVGPSAFVIIDDDASVETVVSVWKSAISGVGQEFSDVYEFREALQRYAMANGFEYELKKNYTNRANGVCTGEGCSWKFNAVRDRTTQSFKIKTMNNVHTCDLESRVNSLVITLNEKLQESPHLNPKEIANQLLKDPEAKSGRKRACRPRPTKVDSSDLEIYKFVGPSALAIIDDDASVETVVSVWKSAISGVGQEFSNIYEFREALQRYAMANGFEYKLKKNYTNCANGVCTGEGCSWKFNAVWDPTTQSFKIKTMNNVHTCDLESRVNSLVITLNEKLQESPHLKPKEIANQLLKDPGVDLNHGTMVVRDERLGSDKESYNMLPWFCDKIIETNPGSISKLIVGENKRFKALFVSFYASLYGFQNSCRPLLFLEATSLRSMYGEVLLTANTIDGNDDFFPVAFAIVDVEDANNWRWFLEQLKAAILYSQPMTFVFDMEKNLKRSVFEVFQDAHVGYSIYHLLESFNRNVKVRCLGGGKYFLAAAHAVRLVGFRKSIEQIKLISSLAYDWVMQIEPQHWANSSFKGERYNHITDDVGGSLAKLMEDYQESSILQKIDALIHSMIDAINDAKLDACMWSTYLTPSKEKQLQEESLRSCGLKVLISSDTLFEVREESTHVVNIGDWSCTCLGWKETGLPCRHSLAVFALIGRNPYEYCANYFTVDAYRLTYLESINQVPIEMEKGEKFEVRKPGFEKGQTLVTVGENEEGGEDIEVEEENGEKIEMKNAGDGNEGKTNGDNDYAEKEDCEKTKAEDEHIDFEIDEAGGEKEESMKVGGGNEESAKVENEKMEAEKHEGVKGKISETDNDPNVPVLPPIHNKWVTTRNLATSTRRNKLVN